VPLDIRIYGANCRFLTSRARLKTIIVPDLDVVREELATTITISGDIICKDYRS